MHFEFSTQGFLKKNLYLIAVLLCAHILAYVIARGSDSSLVHSIVQPFSFDLEENIPTLYSAIALLISCLLLSLITHQRKAINAPYIAWLILSIIFLFLAIDEASSIHERLGPPTRRLLNTSGLLYFSWVIPYGIALIVFVVAYAKFLYNLPRGIMHLFILSGGIFVAGALGLEMVGGSVVDASGRESTLYAVLSTIEELLEMIGIALFNYSLLTYISDEHGALRIDVSKSL